MGRHDQRYFTYIVASRSRVLYVGVTGDIFARVMQHKRGEIEGFTRKYKCNRLVHYEVFGSPVEAIAREKELKGWLRKRKIGIIEQGNPLWDDLAEPWGKQINLGMLFPGKAGKSR